MATAERAFAEGCVLYFALLDLLQKLSPSVSSSMAANLIASEALLATYHLTAIDSGAPAEEIAEVRGVARRWASSVYEDCGAGPAIRAAATKRALLKDDADFSDDDKAKAKAVVDDVLSAILASKGG